MRASRTPLARGGDPTQGRWTQGFAYLPTLNVSPGITGPCTIVPLSDIPPNADMVEWRPYLVWTAVRCGPVGWEQFDFMGRAQEQLELGRIHALERELWAGDIAQSGDPQIPSNLWLAMPSVDSAPSGGRREFGPIDLTPAAGPVSIKRAFGLLEQAIASYGLGARGMIHVRPEATPNFTGVRNEGNLLLTQNGTIVVPGNGYPNLGPGGEPADAGTSWLYATGITEVRWEDSITLTPDPNQRLEDPNWLASALDTRTNTVTVFAQQLAVVSWDGQVHFAVQATLDT